jgi:hypothetical protein
MGFPVKFFTRIGTLLFMNNLYHKIAVASVCTALDFALGANKEVKAATFTLTTPGFIVADTNRDNLGDQIYHTTLSVPVGIIEYNGNEYRALYEFNLANLFFPSSTVIHSAFVQIGLQSFTSYDPGYFNLQFYGYIGNGRADVSDFEAGIIYLDVSQPSPLEQPNDPDPLVFYVTPLINELPSKNDAFAGFNLRSNGKGIARLDGDYARLIIDADVAEPVPELTTIFGSALALGVGGWLKRKKSSQQNKTTSQH